MIVKDDGDDDNDDNLINVVQNHIWTEHKLGRTLSSTHIITDSNHFYSILLLQGSLSDDQIAEHKEAFLLFDKRGDGKVDSAQLGEILRSLGLNPTEADVKKVLKEVDPSGNKRISFEEFLPIFLSIGGKTSTNTSIEGFVDGFACL
ncbi:unnamed protein product [Porites lobata]|uniref:EF-hand domain-containing protein n=1 Tax=Porites lobata TaxID=104759 RepID=A0ABN8P3Z9_9CNID|nr:unnamed protein product [Porites lobata]